MPPRAVAGVDWPPALWLSAGVVRVTCLCIADSLPSASVSTTGHRGHEELSRIAYLCRAVCWGYSQSGLNGVSSDVAAAIHRLFAGTTQGMEDHVPSYANVLHMFCPWCL